MFANIRRGSASTLLALVVAGGCSPLSETDEAPTQEYQQALTAEKDFVDSSGRKWKNNGKVKYAHISYADLERRVGG